MGTYRIKGIQVSTDGDKQVYEEFYKFANFAKEDTEKKIVKVPMKWYPTKIMNNYPFPPSFTVYWSGTFDIEIKGIPYEKVTFFLDCLNFKSK